MLTFHSFFLLKDSQKNIIKCPHILYCKSPGQLCQLKMNTFVLITITLIHIFGISDRHTDGSVYRVAQDKLLVLVSRQGCLGLKNRSWS